MKSKLVSRNPIQRFKQGKSIIKAQEGTKFGDRVGNIELTGPNGKRMLVTYNPQAKHWYDRNTKEVLPKGYTTPDGFKIDGDYAIVANQKNKQGYIRQGITTPAVPKQASPLQQKSQSQYIKDVKSGIRNPNNDMSIYPSTKTLPVWAPKTKSQNTRVTQKTPNTTQTNKVGQTVINSTPSTNNTPQNTRVTQKPSNVGQSPKMGNKRIPTKKTPSTFFGVQAGGQVNNNALSQITADQRAKLIGTGNFTDADFANIKNLQEALNRYFSKDGVGSIKEDNLWGDQTQKAFNMALSKVDIPVLGTNKINTYEAQMNIPTNIEYKPIFNTHNFNRSQTRDLMRAAGYNPYNFTGDQRKALRFYLNGQSNDTSKLEGIDLTKFNINPYEEAPTKKWIPQGQDWRSNLQNALSLSFLKKGGALSPRNVILRFKQSINKN